MSIYNKYNNVKTEVDGIRFDSKAEARRYAELMLLKIGGKVSNLELQPRYDIIIGGKYIAHYKADFRYLDDQGCQIIEDVKGVKTPIYRLKKKLVEALHPGVVITEIK